MMRNRSSFSSHFLILTNCAVAKCKRPSQCMKVKKEHSHSVCPRKMLTSLIVKTMCQDKIYFKKFIMFLFIKCNILWNPRNRQSASDNLIIPCDITKPGAVPTLIVLSHYRARGLRDLTR